MTNQNKNQGDQKSKCCNAPKHTHYMASLSMEGDLCSQCGKKFIDNPCAAGDQVADSNKMNNKALQELVDKVVKAVPEINDRMKGHANVIWPNGEESKVEFPPDIYLHDVLRAINSLGDTKKTYAISQEGKFFSIRYIPTLLDYEVKYYSKWDLSLPLDQQNDEVKEFLYNLLVK